MDKKSIDYVGYEICKALKLERVISLDLHMKVGEPVIVVVEYIPELHIIEQLASLVKEFELVAIT